MKFPNSGDYHAFYQRVYGADTREHKNKPHGWIQWKGTDVCIDLHCSCGYHGHVDSAFFYYYKCPKCKQQYAVSSHVKLIPLTPELIALGDVGPDQFKTCELEEENNA